MKLVTDEKPEGSKYDLIDIHGNVLKFSLRPCGHGCLNTITYTVRHTVVTPMGEVEAEQDVIEVCVRRNKWNPLEYFMDPTKLIKKRIKEVMKRVDNSNKRYLKAKKLAESVEL